MTFEKRGEGVELNKFRDNSRLINELQGFVEYIKEEYGVGLNDIIGLIKKSEIKDESIPISVFDNDKLSAFEVIVKYLHEDADKKLQEIAVLLDRTNGAVWTTYNNSKKKMSSRLKVKISKHSIPLSIIKNRKLSVLESIVKHLKENYELSYHEIAVLLRRNDKQSGQFIAGLKRNEECR